jgi:hypothetical protein
MPQPAPPPETQARRRIVALLAASGWTVQERSELQLEAFLAWIAQPEPELAGSAGPADHQPRCSQRLGSSWIAITLDFVTW